MKKLVIALLISLASLNSAAFAEDWISLGEDQEELKEAWLDLDSILPVAKETQDGKLELIPFIYGSTYRFDFNQFEDLSVVFAGVADLKAGKSRSLSKEEETFWQSEPYGTEGFYFRAYLIKNFAEIQKRSPIVLEDSFFLKDTQPQWEVDEDGWLQVYEVPGLGKAWVQTRTAQLSPLDEDGLPRVRVLVRYQPESKSQAQILPFFYSYEEYNPETRSKNVIRVWNDKWKSLLFRTRMAYTVKVLTPEAAIAAAAYSPFILDPSLIESRPTFVEEDYGVNISQNWKILNKEE